MDNTFKVNDNMAFSATHLIKTKRGLIEAQELKVDDILLGLNGDVKISNIIEYDESKREKAPIIGKL
jgi:hypothetical protein